MHLSPPGKRIVGALLGIDLLFLHLVMPLGTIDLTIWMALLAFAVSLPTLSGSILASFLGRITNETALSILLTTGVLSSLIGITATLWHTSWILGVVFLAALVDTVLTLAFSTSPEQTRTPIQTRPHHTRRHVTREREWEE